MVRIFLACAAVAALLLSPGLIIGPSLDAAVFVQVAERMRDGTTLYAGVWDHKPPGIYLLLVGAQSLLPFLSPWLVSWLLSVACTAATATAVFVTTGRLGPSATAAVGAALISVVVMAQFLLALGGGLTEPVAALPVAIALAIAAGPRGSVSTLKAFWSGVLLASGLLLSVQVAAAGLPLAVLCVGGAARRWPAALATALGAAVPLTAIVLWLYLNGATNGAYDAVVTYGAAYRAVGLAIGVGLAGPVMAWTLLALLFLVIPVAHGTISTLRQPGLPRAAAAACIAWLGLGIVSFVVQGRFLAHYAIPLAVPLAILAGLGLDRLRTLLRVQRTAVVLPIVATVAISLLASVVSGAMEWAPIGRDHVRSQAVAGVAQEHAARNERIWVWGNEPELYLEANRLSATPYSYLYPLVTPGYATVALIEETVTQLDVEPPRLIVDAGSSVPGEPGFQALLIPRPLASDGRDLDLLDPLRDFVAANYRELAIVDGWVIYELRDSAATSDRTGSSQRRLAATRR